MIFFYAFLFLAFSPHISESHTFNLCITGYVCAAVAWSDAGAISSVQNCANVCGTANYKYFDYSTSTKDCFCDNDCAQFTAS
jgi:hypothetical protein